MKYIFLLFMIIPFNANSCIIMPEQNEVSKKYGFSYEVNPSDFDSYSNEINIIAPLVYKGEKFDLGVFSVFLDGRLVSKSVHSTINEDGVPEFFGYVVAIRILHIGYLFYMERGGARNMNFSLEKVLCNHNKPLKCVTATKKTWPSLGLASLAL